jgi:hypothetical protein
MTTTDPRSEPAAPLEFGALAPAQRESSVASKMIAIEKIVVGERHRAFRPDAMPKLMESIPASGLISPISVVETADGYQLVTGRHRLEACRQLGWTEVPALVLDGTALDAELREIDENLCRFELTILERGEHLLRRSEILESLGRRARRGRPRKSIVAAPYVTTANLAQQAGVAERTAQRDMQFARELPKEVRDLLRPTSFANSEKTLLALVAVRRPEDRLEAARLLAACEVTDVDSALHAIEQRFRVCWTCDEVVDGYQFKHTRPSHCEGCGGHFARPAGSSYRGACGRCGTRPPSPEQASPPTPPSPQSIPSGHIANDQPPCPSPGDALPDKRILPFDLKRGRRDQLDLTDLPLTEEDNVERPKASELASRFADAVDAVVSLDVEALAAEASSPEVRNGVRALARWLDRLHPSLVTANETTAEVDA